MPKIVETHYYNGAKRKIARLGLRPLWLELEAILQGFRLEVLEKKHKNSAATLREMIDAEFRKDARWKIQKSGGTDWTICLGTNDTEVCLGVEIQMSGRSDLLIVDVDHLRETIMAGEVDMGVIVVPTDALAYFLTDRVAHYSAAIQAVKRARADELPIVVLGIEHDGPGEALVKRETNLGRSKLGHPARN